MQRLLFFGIFTLVMAASQARAGCGDVARVDAEALAVPVRVCEPDANGACGDILFVGALALGESQHVCSASETIVYQEWDDAVADFLAPITALCDGGVVEL